MPRKKIEVVELNKKEEKIVLEESTSALALFWKRYGMLVFSFLFILSLLVFGVSLFLFIKNLNTNDEMVIKETSIDVSLADYEAKVISNNALTDDSARNIFANDGEYNSKGEVLLVKTIKKNGFVIKFYSDGMALKIMNDGKSITRINPLSNGGYGINEDGVINGQAQSSTIKVTKTKNYPWGTVTYFSDNSAMVSDSNRDLFVRNANDIKDNYISDNKISYLKETKKVGDSVLKYYHDGTVEVVKGNTSYLVRKPGDLEITSSGVTFKNGNEATIYKTIKTNRGDVIDYYTDGGAIIRNGDKTISVRKSNSIKLKNNDIYEIVDNIYVTESKRVGDTVYYTNGGAVVTYNGKTRYVPENSDITYRGDVISSIGNAAEDLVKETNVDNENVKFFDETAVIKTNDYIAIVPKDTLLLDELGKIKDLDYGKTGGEKPQTFTITNSTNELIHYRVALEQSDLTTVDTRYLRYQLITDSKYVAPTKLSDALWGEDDVGKALNISGINYILVEGTIDKYASDEISLMLWADYDTIPNSQMDKYFIGTIKVYAWTEEEKN